MRILLAAERLYAERGLDGVSMREIGAAASQRNNSAVQYHFGDRDSLVRALYELRLGPLNERRGELVTALISAGLSTDPPALIDAFARPLFEVANGSSWYARFVARYVALGSPIDFVPPLDDRLTSSMDTVNALLLDTIASLPPRLRTERARRIQLYITTSIADVEARRAKGELTGRDAEASLRDLVDTAAAILSAPAPTVTQR